MRISFLRASLPSNPSPHPPHNSLLPFPLSMRFMRKVDGVYAELLWTNTYNKTSTLYFSIYKTSQEWPRQRDRVTRVYRISTPLYPPSPTPLKIIIIKFCCDYSLELTMSVIILKVRYIRNLFLIYEICCLLILSSLFLFRRSNCQLPREPQSPKQTHSYLNPFIVPGKKRGGAEK